MQKLSVNDEELGLAEYDDAKITVAADVTCTLFAPLITTVPMFVLYFVSDVRNRLGIIMAFTTLFSIRFVVWCPAGRSGSLCTALPYSLRLGESRFLQRPLRSRPSRSYMVL